MGYRKKDIFFIRNGVICLLFFELIKSFLKDMELNSMC